MCYTFVNKPIHKLPIVRFGCDNQVPAGVVLRSLIGAQILVCKISPLVTVIVTVTVTVTVGVVLRSWIDWSTNPHFCVQIGAALAKAAAARFLQDSVDDGLPIRVLYEHKWASQAPDIPDQAAFVPYAFLETSVFVCVFLYVFFVCVFFLSFCSYLITYFTCLYPGVIVFRICFSTFSSHRFSHTINSANFQSL